MREILTVYEINEKYCKGNFFENLRYTPIYFDDRVITWREFEQWMSQQAGDRKLLVEFFTNVDFLHIRTDIDGD
jgi:hypothetical protein